jgi:hypothetical protein
MACIVKTKRHTTETRNRFRGETRGNKHRERERERERERFLKGSSLVSFLVYTGG